MDISRTIRVILIYHRYKPTNFFNKVNVIRKGTAVISEKRTEHMNTVSGQNSKVHDAELVVTNSYLCALES
jgi:hypothetical protein